MFDGPFGSALKTSDYTAEGFRVARLENIGHLRFRGELSSFVSEEKFLSLSRHVLKADDVLFSSFVDKQTRVCLVPTELDGRMINKADCFCVRSRSDGYDPRLLAYRLAAPAAYTAFSDSVRGVTRPRIGLKDLAGYEIEVPPLAEQRRIVAKLDALTARTSRARADLDRIPALAARYKQAAVAAAMEGNLAVGADGVTTRKRVPFEAAIKRLRTGPFGSALHKHEYVDGGIPLINPMHINGGRLTPSSNMTVSEFKAQELGDFRLAVDDVVIARRGVMGRCAVVRDGEADWIIGTGSMAVTPGPALDAEYLQLFLSSRDVVRALEDNAVGTTMVNLNQGVLLGLEIFLPDLAVQKLIVAKVTATFAEIDRWTADAAAARRLLDRLDQGVLAKAFRGELVPQDPADEPASLLLGRIRAERAGAPKTPRGRRKEVA